MAGEVLVDEARDVRACGCTVAAGVKMANTMSVFVAAEACLTRRSVPPATLVEESSVAIVSLSSASEG